LSPTTYTLPTLRKPEKPMICQSSCVDGQFSDTCVKSKQNLGDF